MRVWLKGEEMGRGAFMIYILQGHEPRGSWDQVTMSFSSELLGLDIIYIPRQFCVERERLERMRALVMFSSFAPLRTKCVIKL